MQKALAIIGLVLILLPAYAQEKVIERSFTGIEELSINLGSGDATFRPGSSSTLEITVSHTYDEDEYTAEFEQKGSKLIVKEKIDRSINWNNSSKWTFTVPEGLDVELNAGSGDVTADNVNITLGINTGSGDLDASEMMGSLAVNSGSGDVEVQDHNGNISINTGSGDVDISSCEGNSVSVNAGSGDISLRRMEGRFSVNTGSGDVEASGLALAEESSFNTGSGDVEVELAKAIEFDLSITSGSGRASLDLNGTKMEGELVMKATKNRGEIDAPFDFDKVEEEDQGRQTIIKKTKRFSSKNVTVSIGTGSGKAVIRE